MIQRALLHQQQHTLLRLLMQQQRFSGNPQITEEFQLARGLLFSRDRSAQRRSEP